MPPLTPQITLTANLESINSGAELGGYLRITLCGYGPQLPAVPGTCMLADAGVPQIIGPQVGSTPISVELFGNDVIQPANTVYEISVLDQNKDVIQSGLYSFTGTQTVDLSQAAQIVQPYGFPLGGLAYLACSGSIPGTVFVAPGPVIAVTYNGVMLRQTLYTVAGNIITLLFTPEAGDRIDAFCIA